MADPRIASIRADGRGTVDAAQIWDELYREGDLLDRAKARTSGFVTTPDADNASTGSAGRIVAEGLTELGTFWLGPVSVRTRKLLVGVRATTWVSGTGRVRAAVQRVTAIPDDTRQGYEATLDRRADFAGGPVTTLGTIEDASTDGQWLEEELYLPDDGADGDWCVTVRVEGDTGFEATLSGVCVRESTTSLDDEGTSIATWSHVRFAGVDADRPDDVHLARRVGRQLAHVRNRYPRVLGQHALAENTATRTTSLGGFVDACYRLPRGPYDVDVTVRVRVDQVTDTAGNGSVTLLLDGATVDTEPIVGTAAQWLTLTIAAADMTPNDVHDLVVMCQPSWALVTETSNTIEVSAVSIYDADEFDAADFDSTDAPGTSFYPGVELARGSPIVSSWTGDADADLRHDDRGGLVRNALFVATSRAQHHAHDVPGPPTVVTGSVDAPGTLWRSRHLVSRGVDRLLVWVRLGLGDYTTSSLTSRPLNVGLYVDSTLVDEERLLRPDSTAPTWIGLPIAEVTEETLVDLEVKVGTTSEGVTLYGIHVVELPSTTPVAAELLLTEGGDSLTTEAGVALTV